jgi:hypothetical protein
VIVSKTKGQLMLNLSINVVDNEYDNNGFRVTKTVSVPHPSTKLVKLAELDVSQAARQYSDIHNVCYSVALQVFFELAELYDQKFYE